MHAEDQSAGLVPVVVFRDVDDVRALKTGALHRIRAAFKITRLLAATDTGNRLVLQPARGING